MTYISPLLDMLFREPRPLHAAWSRLDATPAMDAYRRDDEVIVHLDLPGIARDEIQVEVADGWVSVTGERTYAPEPGDHVFAAERRFGRFERRFRIAGADAGSVRAELANGVLTLTLRTGEHAKPARVEIVERQTSSVLDAPAES